VNEHVSASLADVVGIRLERGQPIVWCLAGALAAEIGSWVVLRRGIDSIGQVVVGRGQCLCFPGSLDKLPGLERPATAAEVPLDAVGAGWELLDALDLGELADRS
jgi:hypothetical protein